MIRYRVTGGAGFIGTYMVEAPGLAGMVFNVGTGQRTTAIQLCILMNKVLNSSHNRRRKR